MNEGLQKIILLIPIFLLSLSVHEFAHGWVAFKKGDPTAKMLGRLTLNPLAHADFIGTFLLPMMGIYYGLPVFGWAKPVPVDPRNLGNPLKDMGLVAAAGPLSNLILAILSTGILAATLHFPIELSWMPALQLFCVVSMQVNLMLFLFNLLPFPPLDGSRIISAVLPPKWAFQFMKVEKYGGILLIVLLFTGGLKYLSIPISYSMHFLLGLAGITTN